MTRQGPYIRFTRKRGEKQARLEIASSAKGPWYRLPLYANTQRDQDRGCDVVTVEHTGHILHSAWLLAVNKDVLDMTVDGECVPKDMELHLV